MIKRIMYYIFSFLFGASILFSQVEKLSVNLERGSGEDCFGSRANCSFSVNRNSSFNKAEEKYLAYGLDDKTLVLEVNSGKLTFSEQKKIAEKPFDAIAYKEVNYFIMEEPFVIDKKSLELLGIDKDYNTIDIGKYAIHKKGEKLTIIIPMKKYNYATNKK